MATGKIASDLSLALCTLSPDHRALSPSKAHAQPRGFDKLSPHLGQRATGA